MCQGCPLGNTQTLTWNLALTQRSSMDSQDYLKSLFEEIGRVTNFELWKGSLTVTTLSSARRRKSQLLYL